MLLIPLNKESKEPLYRQIVHRIAQMIESGKLQNDEMLPPTRRLAETLHVSRQTIVQAYEELWALGYLTSGSGSYTRVRNRMATVQKENRTEAGIDYERLIGTEKVKQLNQLIGRYQPAEAAGKQLIDMSVMNLDSSVFPVKEFQKSLNKVFRDYPDSTLNYGETAGYIKLREWISKRMRDHSTDVFPGEIILTNGISQGFELILKLFTSPGDTVFTESPGYRIANNLMKLHQLNIIEIPLNESGADLDQLEEGIKKCLKTGIIPKLFYTVPSFQNPTGILTSQKHRERLISIGNRYSLPIIEDSFEEEITYFDKKTLPIKSMDVEQIVFYLGTFSKVLFPGIRVGWIAGEKNCIEQMSILKKMSYMSGNTLTHAALYEFCSSGHYEGFLKKVNRHYAAKLKKAIHLMEEHIPEKGCTWNRPTGGYLFWLKIKAGPERESVLMKICASNGVKVAAGSEFFLTNPDAVYLRICISSLSDTEIEKGIPLLGKAIREFLTRK